MSTHPHRPTRRALLSGGAGALLCTAFGRSAAAQQPPPVSLSIGVLRAPASGIIALAEQKGWFAEGGLRLATELFPAAAGPKIIQALGGGSTGLSFVNSTAALLALAAGGVPLRIVSLPTDPSKLFALLSTPAIEGVPQLRGKRVAVTTGTALHYFLARTIAKFDMTLRDIELVNLPAAEGQAAFIAGRVDALVPSVNGRFYLLAAQPNVRELFTHADFERGPGPTRPFVNADVFVTTEQALGTSREALRRFLQVYHDKGSAFLLDPATRPEAIEAITAYVNNEQRTPTDSAIMRRILDDSTFYRAADAKSILASDDFLENLEFQLRFFRDIGVARGTPDLRAAVVRDLL